VICRILDVARSTAYYCEHDRVPVVDEVMAQRIKHLIDAESYLGYRMVWARLRRQGFKINRKAVQRIMQLKGWQCHRRLKKRCSPRVESSPSVALVSDVRWATDATYVWTRLDGLVYVNAVLDCADRQCIGLNVSQRNDAREAAWALEDADPAIRRFAKGRRRRYAENRQRAGLRLGTLSRPGDILWLASGVHSSAHAIAKRRR
jgi:putative transposase